MLDFAKMNGLLPAIIQSETTRDVLMLGFMNEDAYNKTLETGYVYFWSRTRQALWMKGETSGNKLKITSISKDCDDDTLLINAIIEGDGVCCHTGAETCFFTSVEGAANVS